MSGKPARAVLARNKRARTKWAKSSGTRRTPCAGRNTRQLPSITINRRVCFGHASCRHRWIRVRFCRFRLPHTLGDTRALPFGHLNESFLAKPAAAAIALGVLWLLEGLVPMFEGRDRRTRHDAANVALGVFNAAVASFLFAGATLVVTQWADRHGIGLLHWLGWSGAWGFAAAFLLFDLWQYAWHRLNHRVGILWRFHAVHHADRDLSASSGLRFHTGEIVLSSTARLMVLPVLGITLPQLLLYEAVLLPVILFHHGNIKLPGSADRVLRWLIVTPWMHWVHHSVHQPETDSNYSSVFSFWDRLFGSFRLVDNPRLIGLGLRGTRHRDWATLTGMLAMPFHRRRIRRGNGPGLERAARRLRDRQPAGR